MDRRLARTCRCSLQWQRVTWGADLTTPMRAAVAYLRTAFPYWNASGGRNHVFFVFGERQTCLVPADVARQAILIGHWGDVDCMSRRKDVVGSSHLYILKLTRVCSAPTIVVLPFGPQVVPTITPVQHDLPRFGQRLQPAMRKASEAGFERHGPLLLFAGGITSFSASQDNLRKGGNDTEEKRMKWLRRVMNDPCSKPEVCAQCQSAHSWLWHSQVAVCIVCR